MCILLRMRVMCSQIAGNVSFDLSELIFMSLCTVHIAAMSTECFKTDSLFLLHISNRVLSSIYLYNGTGVSRSFMYTRKHLGPIAMSPVALLR